MVNVGVSSVSEGESTFDATSINQSLESAISRSVPRNPNSLVTFVDTRR